LNFDREKTFSVQRQMGKGKIGTYPPFLRPDKEGKRPRSDLPEARSALYP